jgi:hypothetical protein
VGATVGNLNIRLFKPCKLETYNIAVPSYAALNLKQDKLGTVGGDCGSNRATVGNYLIKFFLIRRHLFSGTCPPKSR